MAKNDVMLAPGPGRVRVTIAMTRGVSPAIQRCELTHAPRVPIDVERARLQHAAYERALGEVGCVVQQLDADPDLADSVFVEDIAIVLDEVAIITRPGARSRRAETPVVAAALARYRPIRSIEPPATIDGGDVLVLGRRVFVGQSARTNAPALVQVARILAPYGYLVSAIPVRRCLHLKSAVTAVSEDTLLINRAWVPERAFDGLRFVDVHPHEPSGANAVRVGHDIVYASAFPRTADRLRAQGLRVRVVDLSEIAKAEGALTCCSLLVGRDAVRED